MLGFYFSGNGVANKKLVSLYILTYNQEGFIRQAIDNATQQTYAPLEIIVSDDYSSDMTWDIVKQAVADYKGPHSIIARRNERNLGISPHINEVWKYCSGDWIVASAGDDISLPDRVERIMEVVEVDKSIKLVQSWIEEVDADGNPLKLNRLNCHSDPGALRLYGLEARINGTSYHPHGAAMAYSRDVVDKFSPLPPGIIFEDNIVNLRAELLGRAGVLALPLVKHRNHSGQVTSAAGAESEDKIRERIRLRLDSDVLSSQQSLADITAKREGLKAQQYRRIVKCYRKRLRYFIWKRKALIYTWPVRLFYLAFLLVRPKLAPLSIIDVKRSLIPKRIYVNLKNMRQR